MTNPKPIRFSISDSEAMAFIEREAHRNNYTLSYTASQIVSVAIAKAPSLVREFLQREEVAKRAGEQPMRLKRFRFKNRVYNATEVKVLAELVDLIKLDSVVHNYFKIYQAAGSNCPISWDPFRKAMMRFVQEGLILERKEGGLKKNWTFFLHIDCLHFVNQAIEEGYINEISV